MIYLDNAAATYIDKKVYKKIRPFFSDLYGNPSGIYKFAQKNRAAIDQSRKIIADILYCKTSEIYFTSGGTEANNWAVFGAAEAYKERGKHIITTGIEHDSILKPIYELERRGFKITFLPVDQYGRINLFNLENVIQQNTILVSICYANSETGTVEYIAEIGKLLRKKKILFHTDACQAAGALPINTRELNVDLMTINAGKIYGPKGSGVLYVSNMVKITPLIYGGGQEHRMRGGTENVPGIVGMAEALKIAENMRISEGRRLTELRDDFIQLLKKEIPNIHLNGDPIRRLPNNINISFEGADAESMLLRLDMAGICASAGSACASGSPEPSHVLLGIGLNKLLAQSSVRFTMGRKTTWNELEKTAEILKEIVGTLRKKK